MTNTDERAASFLTRLIAREEGKRGGADDRADRLTEMKSAHLLKEEVAGIKLAVRRHFESQEKRVFRVSAEEFAESLGELRDAPLGTAAMERVAARA